MDMVDHSLLEKNKVHFFAGGRFNNMSDDELADLQSKCANKRVLVYEGVLSGTCVYNLHKMEKYEKQLNKIKREAVMPTPEPYVPLPPRTEPSDGMAAVTSSSAATSLDPETIASIITASVAAAM